ncbi:MAG: D-alanyl-D-alanine carboxypeptidase [Chlamydiae bacterium]|nr:D-alanyl-D-alanine carboxypeptidase [Chlamydiota bacterium]
MMKIFLIFGLLLCPILIHSEQLRIDLQAKSAILMNGKTGRILYEKNGHELAYPASITKIAVALYALEKWSEKLDENITVSKEALKIAIPSTAESQNTHPYHLQTGGKNMGLKVGEILSFRDLIYGVLVSSGNDASNVIGIACSGTIERFMDELNEYLKNCGLSHTHFCNPHGLHHPNHVTTAYEMAKITQRALMNPTFCQIVKTSSYEKPKSNKQEGNLIQQTNRLLRKGKYFYPKAIGVKTGYTDKAGYNLVAAAAENGRLLIAVLLGYTEPFARFQEAISLFEKAFQEKMVSRTLFTKNYSQFSKKIPGAKQLLKAELFEDVKIDYFPSEEPELKADLYWKNLSLPVRKGDPVGKIAIESIGEFPLYAVANVEKTFWKKCFDFFQFLKIPLIILSFVGISFFLFLLVRYSKKLS